MENDTRNQIAAARAERKKKVRRKNIGLVLRLLLVIVGVVFLASLITVSTVRDVADFFSVSFSRGSFPAELSDSAPQQIGQMSNCFFVRTEDSVLVIGRYGQRLQEINAEFQTPGAAYCDNRVAVYGAGDLHLSVYNRTKELYSVVTQYPIISAAVSSRYTAVLCRSSGYNAELVLYNRSGETVFTWKCAQGYPYAAFFDGDSSHILVCCAVIADGVLSTDVILIRISGMEEVYETPVRLGFTVAHIEADNDRFIAVGTSASVLVEDNTALKEYQYRGLSLLSFAFERNGDFAIAVGDNIKPSINRVLLFDEDFENRFDVRLGEVVRDLVCADNRVYVLTDSSIAALSRLGDIAISYESQYNTVGMVVFDSIVQILPDAAVAIEK